MKIAFCRRMAPIALAGLVGVAGLSPLPATTFAPATIAQEGKGGGQGTRLMMFNGRAYSALVRLAVMIPGTHIEGQDPDITMTCSLNLTSVDGRPVGQLPATFTMWVKYGSQTRLVQLQRMGEAGGNTPVPGMTSATYAARTSWFGPFNARELPPAAPTVHLQWREGRRIRTIGFGPVPFTFVALP